MLFSTELISSEPANLVVMGYWVAPSWSHIVTQNYWTDAILECQFSTEQHWPEGTLELLEQKWIAGLPSYHNVSAWKSNYDTWNSMWANFTIELDESAGSTRFFCCNYTDDKTGASYLSEIMKVEVLPEVQVLPASSHDIWLVGSATPVTCQYPHITGKVEVKWEQPSQFRSKTRQRPSEDDAMKSESILTIYSPNSRPGDNDTTRCSVYYPEDTITRYHGNTVRFFGKGFEYYPKRSEIVDITVPGVERLTYSTNSSGLIVGDEVYVRCSVLAGEEPSWTRVEWSGGSVVREEEPTVTFDGTHYNYGGLFRVERANVATKGGVLSCSVSDCDVSMTTS
eukprot:sb/3466474/